MSTPRPHGAGWGGTAPRVAAGAVLAVGLVAAGLLPAGAVPSAAGTTTPTPAASPSSSAAAPTTVALPPATASVDVAPVVTLAGPVTPLVAPVAELITRTASVDGAVGHDEAPEQEHYTLSGDVFFEPDSAALTPRAQEELALIAASLAAAGPESVEVVGHTDSVDDEAHNQQLSVDRAASVQAFLLSQVPGLAVSTQGRGESQPLAVEEGAPADVDRARALNRRVEITATR